MKSTPLSKRLGRCDVALFSAFLLIVVLGTWTRSLLVNDGAIFLTAIWLGNAWDLYLSQIAGRAVSTLVAFGPAWSLRSAIGLSSDAFIVVAHLLYFATPLVLWFVLRVVEPQRSFSLLYLAVAMVLVFFPSELIVGIGFWMIWLALISDPAISRAGIAVTTALFAPILAFTHPAIALMCLLLGLAGTALILLGKPFPRRLSIAAVTMAAVLFGVYFVLAALLPAGNPTIAAQLAGAKYDYINPVWMLGTLGFFPALAVLWLLLLAPGLKGANIRWRLAPVAVLVIGTIGLWFAFNGTNPLMWIFARQTAPYVLVLALCLALASPTAAWLAAARLPLTVFAIVIVAASISYAVDLVLFGRAADARLAPIVGTADQSLRFVDVGQSTATSVQTALQVYFKWSAGNDYVRDVVVPYYGGQRMTFAFYTYFRSDRHAVLFRPLDRPGEWIPFECAPVKRAMHQARDDLDRQMLDFVQRRYCVGR